ncbi:hypothetical protein V490_05113 [Pseudogymnoascus sp. VKM F-3557]|nr:hypothetical protein V490_05113 [Pseudogymnoascus sp. VKM F-3557]
MSLSSYLASKYLTADPGPSSSSTKKRKRKTKDASAGLIIADDDADWAPTRKDDEEDNMAAMTTGSSAEFRKAKQSAWKSVREPAAGGAGDDAQADAIVAQAARENEEAGREDEDPKRSGGRGADGEGG